MIEDLKSRPERVALLKRVGAVVGFVLVILVALLLSRGKPAPKKKPTLAITEPKVPQSEGVRDAFALAKAAEPILRGDARFGRVYFVPTASTPTQKLGKIMVMGEMASEEDLHALQAEMVKHGISVPLEWQVSLSQSGGPAH
jgi:hypothetical protein